MRKSFAKTLCDLAANDDKVFLCVADNGAIVFDEYRERFPDRFLNFGIAEQNMISCAAGMALQGYKPYCYTIASFMCYRAFEQIRNDVCLQNLNIKIIGIGGGMTYSKAGATHHGTEDIGAMRILPNMTVIVPASPMEVSKAVLASYNTNNPTYIRLEGTGEQEIYQSDYDFQIGKGVILQEGRHSTIISCGSIINKVIEEYQNTNCNIINMHTIKPIDVDLIKNIASKTMNIITVEEHNIVGGLGSAVAEVIAKNGLNISLHRIGLHDFAKGNGTREQMIEQNIL